MYTSYRIVCIRNKQVHNLYDHKHTYLCCDQDNDEAREERGKDLSHSTGTSPRHQTKLRRACRRNRRQRSAQAFNTLIKELLTMDIWMCGLHHT